MARFLKFYSKNNETAQHMRDLNIALRSLFKKGRHNLMKIASLSIGLAVALVLIAKIYFVKSYDTFYPDAERTYRLTENYSTADDKGIVRFYKINFRN